MTKNRIFKKDGSPTPYFWTEEDGTEQTSKTVYKDAGDAVKRMKGVHFDAVANRIHKH
jgi:hypothetical protein